MYKIVLLFLFIASFFSIKSQNTTFKNGDLLFQNLDCGPLCDAIENATFNDKNYKISHVGIILIEKDSIYVIEAFNKVDKTPLQKFLNRSKTALNKPRVVHARLKKEYQKYIPTFLKRLKLQIGKAYDTEFKLYNDKFYCSELIYETLLDDNKKPLFKVKPMTFKNKRTKKFDQAWISYFKKQQIPIPEGKLGCNPADYMQSNLINILYFYY